MRAATVGLLFVLFAARASAQSDICADTFPERLADAKRALLEYDAHLAAAEKARSAIEWFEANCRFLSKLELAARKVDDPNAFVCDPKAKGRPKRLTSELVLQFSTVPALGSYQNFHGENHRCQEHDHAERVSLVFVDGSAKAHVRQQLKVMCWGDERERCAKARASIAAERAKGGQDGT